MAHAQVTWMESELKRHEPDRHLASSASYLSIIPFIRAFLSRSFSYLRFHSSAVSSSLTITEFLIVFALNNKIYKHHVMSYCLIIIIQHLNITHNFIWTCYNCKVNQRCLDLNVVVKAPKHTSTGNLFHIWDAATGSSSTGSKAVMLLHYCWMNILLIVLFKNLPFCNC